MSVSKDYVYPEGFYRVKAIGNTLTKSKTSDNFYLVVKVEVLEMTGKGKKDVRPGGYAYLNLFFTEKTKERTLEFLKDAGFDVKTQAPAQLVADHPDHVSIEGFEFSAKCKHDEWNGQKKAKFELSFNYRLSNPNGWMENHPAPNHRQLSELNSLFGYKAPSTAFVGGADGVDAPW